MKYDTTANATNVENSIDIGRAEKKQWRVRRANQFPSVSSTNGGWWDPFPPMTHVCMYAFTCRFHSVVILTIKPPPIGSYGREHATHNQSLLSKIRSLTSHQSHQSAGESGDSPPKPQIPDAANQTTFPNCHALEYQSN